MQCRALLRDYTKTLEYIGYYQAQKTNTLYMVHKCIDILMNNYTCTLAYIHLNIYAFTFLARRSCIESFKISYNCDVQHMKHVGVHIIARYMRRCTYCYSDATSARHQEAETHVVWEFPVSCVRYIIHTQTYYVDPRLALRMSYP